MFLDPQGCFGASQALEASQDRVWSSLGVSGVRRTLKDPRHLCEA